MTDSYGYQAFGVLNTSSGTSANPYRFFGQIGYYNDNDSGLLSLRARYLDTFRQRFISPDPFELFPANARLYQYADNVGSSRVDLQACKLEYSIVSPK